MPCHADSTTDAETSRTRDEHKQTEKKRKEKSNRLCQTTRTVDFDKSNMEKYNFFSQNKLERDGGTFNFYWFS